MVDRTRMNNNNNNNILKCRRVRPAPLQTLMVRTGNKAEVDDDAMTTMVVGGRGTYSVSATQIRVVCRTLAMPGPRWQAFASFLP